MHTLFTKNVDGLPAATKDLGVVLVDSPLGATDCRDVLGHNDVIRVLALGRLVLATRNGGL